jgi:hypothetical protein
MVLRGLLFSVGTLILLTLVSLLVVGVVKIIYKFVHKETPPKPAVK